MREMYEVDGVFYTNNHDLPPEVVAALIADRYTDESEEPSDYSASKLVAPVQQTILMKRYKSTDKLIVRDVIDLMWRFYGSIAHTVLEESWHKSMGGFVEKRLYMEVQGKSISGKPDRYVDGMVRDYKTTKVYKLIKNDHTDWAAQQNVYAQLCREAGLDIREIRIVCLINNWQEGEKYKTNYPEAPIVMIPIRVWSEEEAKRYIEMRVKKLIEADSMTDAELAEKMPCSDHERWNDLKDFAIFRMDDEKRVRATKTCATRQEANDHIVEKGWESTHEVVQRMEGPRRCQKYCDCAAICHQYQAELKGDGDESETESPLF